MDISPEYISQCEKAEEIQAQRVDWYYQGDWYVIQKPSILIYVVTGDKADDRTPAPFEVWLPRQDQLQKMLWMWDIHGMIQEFYEFANYLSPQGKTYQNQFTSMEQLWLAFCMSERFGKAWDGEGWVLSDAHRVAGLKK